VLSHSSHSVRCAAGNLDTPRNRGAADRALANARPVSPSASYLKRHQVTKCPCSWLGSSCVGIPSLRRRSVGPPPSAIHGGGRLSRHPCRSAHCATPAFSLHPSRDWCRLGHRALRSKIKINSKHGCPSRPNSCGRRRRSRRYGPRFGRGGGSVMKLSTDLPLSFDRGPGCQSSSVSHSVRCAAGNLDTPRNRGAADRALANARPVSPSASYLKRHQVTKCPCSWLGSSFVGIPSLRRRSVGPSPSAIHCGGRLSRHPCRSAHCATPAFSLHPSRDLWCLGLLALKSRSRSRGRGRIAIGELGLGLGSVRKGGLRWLLVLLLSARRLMRHKSRLRLARTQLSIRYNG
jgi:hypothetical protein